MAAPAFASVGTYLSEAASTSAVIDAPSGVVSGDLVIVFLYKENGNAVTLGTGAAGFTQIDVVANSAGSEDQWLYAFWRRSTGSEPTSYTFSWTGSAFRTGAAFRITNAAPTGSPVDVYATALTSSTASSTTPAVSVTTTGVDRLLIWAGTSWDASTWTGPTSWTGRITTPSSRVLHVATREQLTAGSSGNVTATASPNSHNAFLIALLPADFIVPLQSDAGTGTDTATVDKTEIRTLPEVGTGTDTATISADFGALAETGTGTDSITVDQLVDVVVTDSGTGSDSIERLDFLANDLTDSGTGSDSINIVRTNFVNLTDAGTGVDSTAQEQQRALTDAGLGVDHLLNVATSVLVDSGTGSDSISVTVIPFTQVLPLREGTIYDLVVVARVPQIAGPPTFEQIDPIEWKSLSYSNTLSQPQELEASCLISSVPESIWQRLRALHEQATELWLLRDGEIVYAGPLGTWQTSGENLTLRSKGLLSYLDGMVVHTDQRFANVDQHLIVKQLVDQWQALDYGNFGIDTADVVPSGQLRSEDYLRDELHKVGQRVEELGKQSLGFDVEVNAASRKLELWYPGKGTDRSVGEDAIVFDQRNISSGDILASVVGGDLASEAYGTSGSAGSDDVKFSLQSNTELRARYGRYAVTGTWSDIKDQATLDLQTLGLLEARAQVLLVPGPKLRVTPDADLSAYGVGDLIAYDLAGQLGINGAFRIRKQTITVQPTGQESVDLEFV